MEIGVDIYITLIIFENNIEKALLQNGKRKRYIPDYVIKKHSAKLEDPILWEQYNCAIIEVK